MTELIVGLDLGTSSVKAIAVDGAGKVVSSSSAAYPIQRPAEGCAEQDPEAWWNAVLTVLSGVVRAVPRPSDIVAIGMCGQMHGTVLLDRNGHPLSPAIIWPDQRSHAQVDALMGEQSETWYIARTGGLPATGFQIATLRWVQEKRHDLWPQIVHILLPKDYIRWRLTGELSTDPSDACGSLLLDIRSRQWSSEMLALANVRGSQLPEIRPSQTVVGKLKREVATALGLSPEVVVVNGAADTACSVLSASATSPDTLLITLSTGGQMVWPQLEPRTDPAGRAYTFCSALEPTPEAAGWYLLGGPLAAGLALKWLLEQVIGARSEAAIAAVLTAAESVPAGAGGLTFLPHLVGERTPHRDPLARGSFHGLSPEHGQPELVRAVMEGVALAFLDGYAAFTALGAAPKRLILSGGGAHHALWRRIIAEAFGMEVCWLAAEDQSAYGAAALAGAGLGRFDAVEAVARWVGCRESIAPDPGAAQTYLAQLERYRTLKQSAPPPAR